MTSSTPKNMQYKNISGSVSTSQKSDGCQAKMKDGRKCGETKNLQIIQEFKRLYESKMQQIDDAAGGDCVQAKINLQREWINDLTDQNEMLVRVVEELEVEAAERVTMLEEKLENSAKCACENEKAAKEKDKKINELEERIKKINEMAEKNEEARKSCHQYAELKKEKETDALLDKLYNENSELCAQVKTLKMTVFQIKSEIRCKNGKCHCTTQTSPVCVSDRGVCVEMEQEKEVQEANAALVENLDQGVNKLLQEMSCKDNQLKEQHELLVLMVQKLFFVYKSLKRLDSEVSLMVEQQGNSCRCDTAETIERYECIVHVLQNGLRESVKGIQDKCEP